MDRSDEVDKAELAREPFPPTHSTLRDPRRRGALNDRRLDDRTAGSTLEDQEIAGQVRFALAEDGRVDLGDGLNDRITVKCEGGIATITGVVDSAGKRMAVEELVESVPGVELVQDALTISVDRHLDDADLDREVRASLERAGLEWVGSRVCRGSVRLMGAARKLADAERAVKVAAAVKGTREVIDNIKVRTPDHTDDIDLLGLVTQSLALNDLEVLDREVRIEDGVVHIQGTVKSLADRRRIHSLVGEIPGVRGIRELVQVDWAPFRNREARR